MERLAPTHLRTPAGVRVRIHYPSGDGPPILPVRIQDAFGWTDTPRIADGRQPLLMHLLSPARRPVQITSDLAGFWRTGYFEARKQLRARYPRHAWPDMPVSPERVVTEKRTNRKHRGL